LKVSLVRNELRKVGQVLLVKLEDMLSRGLGSGLAATVDDAAVEVDVDGDSVEGASVMLSGGIVSVGDGIELWLVYVDVTVTIVVEGTLME
jgi:hypothetical protein